MGAIEELAQLFAGNDVQKTIAAENPYLQGANTVDQVGQVVQQAAGTGRYGLGELGVSSAITGLLGGLLSGAGGNYQNTLTTRYNDTLAKLQGGQAVDAESTGLPANIFQKADTNARLFKKVQELKDQEKIDNIAAEVALRTNPQLFKAEALKSAVSTGEKDVDEAIAELSGGGGQITNAVEGNVNGAIRVPKRLAKDLNEEIATAEKLDRSLGFIGDGFKKAKQLNGSKSALLSKFTGIPTYDGDQLQGLNTGMLFQVDVGLQREVNDKARAHLETLLPTAYDTDEIIDRKERDFKAFVKTLPKTTPILNSLGVKPKLDEPLPVETPAPAPKLKASDLISQGYVKTAQGWVKGG